jgi:shikimate dehydrogenase
VRFFSRIFGLRVVDHNCIADPNGRVLSTVLADNARDTQIIINEPADQGTDCERFLSQNFGDGIQHLAFITDDIFAYLDNIRKNNVEILRIPDIYYENLLKEGYDSALVEILRKYSVMLDTEGGGRFLHAYTHPIDGGLFFEFVQRDHHRGFGRHDATARLMAQKGITSLPESAAVPLLLPDLLDAAVDGNTLLLGTVGDTPTRLRMPEIMGHWLGLNGINAVWLPFKVHPGHLPKFVAGIRALDNLLGVSVANPHKRDVTPFLDRLSERARTVGGVNVIRREKDGSLTGDIVDGTGFVRGLEKLGVEAKGADVWLVGTDVDGQAIAFALAEAGVHSLAIEDIEADTDQARGLVERLASRFPDLLLTSGKPIDFSKITLAVNSSTLGREPDDPVPLDTSLLPPGTLVGDVVARPAMTRLLSEAEARGLPLYPGRLMLEGQIADYVTFFGINV